MSNFLLQPNFHALGTYLNKKYCTANFYYQIYVSFLAGFQFGALKVKTPGCYESLANIIGRKRE